MQKLISIIPRRQDYSRAAFRTYYETRHTPLALKYLRKFRKYVRNHLSLTRAGEAPFDVLTEFWYTDKMEALVTTDEVAQRLKEDEIAFMDREGTVYFDVAESLLAGPPRGVEPAVSAKLMLLLKRNPEYEQSAFLADLPRLLQNGADEVLRVTLDLPQVTPDAKGVPPADAFLSLWPLSPDLDLRLGPLPPTIASCLPLWVDAHETAPANLND